MNEKAPITWLIDRINEIVSAGAGSAAEAISSTIAPLVSVFFGIYIILITVNYMRGAASEPILDFGLRCVNFAVVIGLGLNAANYANTVIPMVTGLGNDLANAVSHGSANANTLDELAKHYLKIIEDGFTAAAALPSVFDRIEKMYLVYAKTIIVLFGLVPFLVAATLTIIVANVGSLLVAIVGPLFFAFLLFPATRQYFSSWLNTAFSYALIPLFVAIISTISVSLSKDMLSGGTLLNTTFTRVFLAAVGNLILLFLLKQVSALASSLSAGGINAAMPGGIGSAAKGISNSLKGSAKEMKGVAKGAMATYKGAKQLGNFLANRSNSVRKAG